MGWSYRRSAKFGPFRLNFSKSGIGLSTGVKGARISTGPRGTYVNLGSNGVYYRQKVGRSETGPSSSHSPKQRVSSYGQNAKSPQGGLNYPSFPDHGPPRIVTTLALLAVPLVLLLIFILTFIGIATSSSSKPSISTNTGESLSQTVGRKTVEAKRDQGYLAGYDYWLHSSTSKTQKPNPLRVKKLAEKAAEKEHQEQEWQLGWIAGYNKAFELASAKVASVQGAVVGQTISRRASTTTFQSLPRSTSNGYIRGPRGGCYYLSGSGGKVYVDRGMCN